MTPRRTGQLMGAEIRARRSDLGIPQAMLAGALDVNPNTLAQWERDERPVGHPRMLRLALDRLAEGVKRGACCGCGAAVASIWPERCHRCQSIQCGECWEAGHCRASA